MIKKISVTLSLLVLFAGCEQENKPKLDGKKLLEQKCSQCHNIKLPPETYEDEKAPPMMAVAFHIKDFIQTNNESERIPKAIEFIKDYVINPSASKSFCDKKSLETYGVMPSQKGLVTQDELQAISQYMLKHFTVKNLTEAQDIQNKLNKMAPGQRLAIKYNCLGCHKINKDLVGPSFSKIAKRYSTNLETIGNSIKNGSSKKWDISHGRVMPHFKDKIPQDEIKILSKWIKAQK
jgi:cytochrome c